MQNGKKSKTNRITEKVVISVLVCLILFSLYLLTKARTRNSTNTVGHTIKLIQKTNDVRKKSTTELNWFPSVTGEYFAPHDMVFTGNKSFGKLQFSDESIIRLSPNSIISVEADIADSLLKVHKGEFRGELGRNTKIQLNNDKTVKSSSKTNVMPSFNLKFSKGRGLKLTVQSGEMTLESPGKQKRLIKEGQSIRQFGSKTVLVEKKAGYSPSKKNINEREENRKTREASAKQVKTKRTEAKRTEAKLTEAKLTEPKEAKAKEAKPKDAKAKEAKTKDDQEKLDSSQKNMKQGKKRSEILLNRIKGLFIKMKNTLFSE